MFDPQDVPKHIDKARALEIARETAAELPGHYDFVIMDNETVERPFGWVFFYAPRQYVLANRITTPIQGAFQSRNGRVVVAEAQALTRVFSS